MHVNMLYSRQECKTHLDEVAVEQCGAQLAHISRSALTQLLACKTAGACDFHGLGISF